MIIIKNPDDGEMVSLDAAPDADLADLGYEGWEVTEKPVAVAQEQAWTAVKAIRTKLETDTAPTPLGHRVQIDDASKTKINGLLAMARLAEEAQLTFTEQFTMADNEVITLDSTSVRQLAMAAAQYVSAVYARARELREEIFADGLTAEQVGAIDISSGWPN